MSYDGEIRIKTKVDTSQMQRLQIQIDKAAGKVESLVKKYEELKNKKIPTDDYKEVQKQIDATQARLDKLLLKKESFKGSHKSASWLNMNAEIEELQKSLPYMKGELQDLVDTGKAFTLGKDSEEFRQVGADLSRANAELRALVTKQNELNGKSGKLSDTLKKTASASKKLFGSMSRDVKKTGGLFSTFGSRLKGIALSLLVFNWITKGFNSMVAGMKEGYQNLVRYSDKYNKSASAMMSANTQMKNSFSTAFAPLIELVMPYLIKFVGFLTEAANRVAQFTAALTGAKTWTKAIAVQQDYASSLDGTATAAKKAAKALAGFDELNVLSHADTSGGATALNPKDMFAEVEIPSEITGMLAGLREFFAPVIDAANELYDSCKPLITTVKDGLRWFYDNVLVPFASYSISDLIPAFFDLLGGGADALNAILVACQPAFSWLWDNFLKPALKWTGQKVIDGLKGITAKLHDFSNWATANEANMSLVSSIVLGFLAGIVTYCTVKNVISLLEKIKKAIALFGDASFIMQGKVALAALAIGVLAAGIIYLAQNWDRLSGCQQAITILGALAAAAIAAAVAVAVFHTAWSVGVAAAAIAGGLALLGLTSAFLNYNDSQILTKGNSRTGQSFNNSHDFSKSPLPALADGAVFRGGNPYAAIVNDQPMGHTNIEAPLDTIKQGLREVMAENGVGGEYTFVAKLDGREIFRETVKQDKMHAKSTGHSAFWH